MALAVFMPNQNPTELEAARCARGSCDSDRKTARTAEGATFVNRPPEPPKRYVFQLPFTSDGKQVCIGWVVTREGLPVAYEVFDVQVGDVERDGVSGLLKVTFSKRKVWREWAELREGCCLLRTNLVGWSPEDLWRT